MWGADRPGTLPGCALKPLARFPVQLVTLSLALGLVTRTSLCLPSLAGFSTLGRSAPRLYSKQFCCQFGKPRYSWPRRLQA